MPRRAYIGALVIVFLTAFACYSLGVSGPFLLDDFTNFKRLEFIDGTLNGYLLAIFSNAGDALNRPISYASFVVNSEDWPNNPAGFKWINLVLHVACGLALLLCIKLVPYKNLQAKNTFAVFLAGLWLLSPLNVSTVLYAVQRMTILSGLFGLVAIIFYLKARVAINEKKALVCLSLSSLCVGLSFLSKENGILLIPLIGLLHMYLNGQRSLSALPVWFDRVVYIGLIIFSLLLIYLLYKCLFRFGNRPFDAWERFLLQGKILTDYVYLSYLPNVSYMSLHHDGYEQFTKSMLFVGGVLWVVHFSIIALSVKLWARHSLVAFGVLWFYVSHLVESTVVPLELMFEHRNYFPSIGLYLIVAAAIAKYHSRLDMETTWLKPAIMSVPLIIFSILLAYRSALWSDHFTLATKWAAFKKDSPRAQYIFSAELDQAGFKSMAYGKIRESAERFNRLGFYLYTWRLQCELGDSLEGDRIIFPSNEKILSMNHTSDVTLELNKLLDRWADGKCIPDGFTHGDVSEFLDAVLNMKLLEKKKSYKALILVANGQFYSKLGDFNKAAQAWRELYKIQPTIDNAFRNIDFALKFGLYDYAYEYLANAKELNSGMSWLVGDQSSLIETYAVKIEETKAAQNPNY